MKKLTAFFLIFALIMSISPVPVMANTVEFNSATATVMAGHTSDVIVTLINNSYSPISGVNVMCTGSGVTAVIVGSSTTMTLMPGEMFQIPISINAIDNQGAGNASIRLQASYSDFSGKWLMIEGTVDVIITEPEIYSPPVQTAVVPTVEPDYKPDIVITAPKSYVTTMPGQSVSVSITFKNNSRDNLAKELSVNSGMFVGFKTEVASRYPAMITPGESVSFTYILTPESDLDAGTYTIPFTYVYKSKNNKTFTDESTVTVVVEKKPTLLPNLVIDNIKTDPDFIEAGDKFNIFADVKNIGQGNAQNIEINVSGFDTSKISLTGSDTVALSSLESGHIHTPSFELLVNKNLATGTYPIKYTIKYSDSQGQIKTFESSYYVNVISSESTDRERAHLEVVEITKPSKKFDVGEEALIYYTVINNGTAAAKNVKVSAKIYMDSSVDEILGAQPLVPTSSNLQIINSLEPGESQTLTFGFTPTESAKTQTYMIGFTTEYETGIVSEIGTRQTESFIQYSGVDVLNVASSESTDKERAHLEVVEITKPSKKFEVGEEALIYYTITNNGTAAAKNVKISAKIYMDPSSVDDILGVQPLVPTSSNIQIINNLEPGENQTFTFGFTPTESAKTQTYMMGFTAEYETGIVNEAGIRESESFTQYSAVDVHISEIKKDENQPKALLEILSMTNLSKEHSVGESGQIEVVIINNGDLSAKNIKITGVAPEGIVPTSTNVLMHKEIAAGESVSFKFSFAPTSLARTQTYMIGFEVEYENGIINTDESKVKENFVQYSGINAYVPEPTPAPDEGKTKSVPKIILSEYQVTSDNEENSRIVLAGQEFDIFLKVKNTHIERTVRNIIVSLSVPETASNTSGNVFSPVGGSNSFYIDEIAPGGEFEKTIRMFCLNNAPGRNYVVNVTFNYEDEEGDPYETREEAGVTVRQQAKMELGAINFPESVSVGESIFFSFSIRNTGYVTLRNLKINAEGEGFDQTGGEYIIGNFTAGSYDYFDGSITALESGDKKVRVVVTYDLDTGEHIEEVEEATVQVVDYGGGGDVFGSNTQSGSQPIIREVGGGATVAISMGTSSSTGTRPQTGNSDLDSITFDGETAEDENIIQRYFNIALDKLQEFSQEMWFWIAVGGFVLLVIIIIISRRRKHKKDMDFGD